MDSEQDNLKIGLAFSGGGFRATSFCLGVISYLHQVDFEDKKLLEQVIALSTVSGGTFTGARYAVGIKKGESFDDIYRALYHYMSEVDLAECSLTNLIDSKRWKGKRIRSLINACADVYEEYLFKGDKFGLLLNGEQEIHIKHITFNATEFDNALPFRFQKTETRNNIGNGRLIIPDDVAQHIRIADIVATSSCFPGGFEPINYPFDFSLPEDIDPKRCIQEKDSYQGYKEDSYQRYKHKRAVQEEYTEIESRENQGKENKIGLPVGLMDGGIVDNQGIESLLLAENRMKSKRKREGKEITENEFDLLILADVSSPYMEDFTASKEKTKGCWRKLTFRQLIWVNLIVLLGSMAWLGVCIKNDQLILSTLLSGVIILNLLLFFLLYFIRRVPKIFRVPPAFLKPLKKLVKLRFSIYENMFSNRVDSLLKMANDVFLKRIRALMYHRIYDDETWKNRSIMSAIYELRPTEKRLQARIREGKVRNELIPTEKVYSVAQLATSMGTTLWFTKKELEDKDMLNSIIACGQFTLCWNLLEYISFIKKDKENINHNHEKLITCEAQLLEHWENFKKNPYWLINEINQKNGLKISKP